MSTLSHANYLLIDGVLRANAIADLHQLGEPLEIHPLYLSTRWAELNQLGPLLVSLPRSSTLIDSTLQRQAGHADASLFYSPEPISTVADHLRRFIAPTDVHGGKGLLRFADPLVTRYWLGSYSDKPLDGVLGPIETWFTPEFAHAWERTGPLEWRSFSRTAPALEWHESYAGLGEAQLAALTQAARWRFVERLHRSFAQSQAEHLARINKNQLSQWYEERLNDAQAWGLISERSLAIWIEYSLRWGTEFAVAPSTPYQQWLSQTPAFAKLAPEMRIQQMDNDCWNLNLNKDV